MRIRGIPITRDGYPLGPNEEWRRDREDCRHVFFVLFFFIFFTFVYLIICHHCTRYISSHWHSTPPPFSSFHLPSSIFPSASQSSSLSIVLLPILLPILRSTSPLSLLHLSVYDYELYCDRSVLHCCCAAAAVVIELPAPGPRPMFPSSSN